MSELEALRAKLISLWNPPQAVSKHPDQYVMTIRIRLSRDHRLVGQPEVLNSGEGPLFEATRDSAIQAVIQGQPYDMLSPSTYDVWKDITLNFNPRDVYVPEPPETSTPPSPKTPPEDRAFYPEYVPGSTSGFTAAAGCEEPLLNTLFPWSSLEACQEMYKASNFIEFPCEREALFKQRTAPHLFCCRTTSMALERCQQEKSLHGVACRKRQVEHVGYNLPMVEGRELNNNFSGPA